MSIWADNAPHTRIYTPKMNCEDSESSQSAPEIPDPFQNKSRREGELITCKPSFCEMFRRAHVQHVSQTEIHAEAQMSPRQILKGWE